MRLPDQQSKLWLFGMLFMITIAGILIYAAMTTDNLMLLAFMGVVIGIFWARIRLDRWIYVIIMLFPLTPEFELYQMGWEKTEGLRGVSANAGDFVMPIVLGLFFLKKMQTKIPSFISNYFIGIPLAMFILIVLISLTFSLLNWGVMYYFLNGLGHFLKWAGYVLLYFVIINEFKEKNTIHNAIRILVVAFAIGAVFALLQYAQSLRTHVDYTYINPLRSTGVIEGANAYGVMLAFMITIIFNVLFRASNQNLYPRLFLQICLGLYFAALVATFSRAGWVAAFFGLSIVAARGRRNYLAVPLIVLVIIGIWYSSRAVRLRVYETIYPTRAETLPIDVGGREGIWRRSISEIDFYNFFIGCGYFCFPFIYRYTTPHNLYLSLLLEVGIFGLLTFLWLIFRMMRYLYFVYHFSIDSYLKELSFSIMVGISAILVANLSGEFFYAGTFLFVILIFFSTSQILYHYEYLERTTDLNIPTGQFVKQPEKKIQLIQSPVTK